MKTMLLNIALLTALIMLALSLSTDTIGQTVTSEIENVREFGLMQSENGMIISSREIRLKSHVDSKEFEKWINEYWNVEWQDLIAGYQSYVGKSERRLDNNQYAHFLVIKPRKISESKSFDSEDDLQLYREFIYYEPTKRLYEELFEYIEIDPFLNNIVRYTVK